MKPYPDLSSIINFDEINEQIQNQRIDIEIELEQLHELAIDGDSETKFYVANKFFYDFRSRSKPESKVIALELYIKAAQSGHIQSQEKLGSIFKEDRNIEMAIFWYTKSAQHSTTSQYELALIYSNTENAFVDFDLAFYWCKKASDSQLSPVISDSQPSPTKFLSELFNVKASNAILLMSKFYENGIGTSVDFEMSYILCGIAASLRNKEAQSRIPELYIKGLKVDSNLKKYDYWKTYKYYLKWSL